MPNHVAARAGPHRLRQSEGLPDGGGGWQAARRIGIWRTSASFGAKESVEHTGLVEKSDTPETTLRDAVELLAYLVPVRRGCG